MSRNGSEARPEIARESRAFLVRAVPYLAGEAGVRQFLDIGTGLPTANNTHEVAQGVAPESRVVYVDNDRCKSGCVHAVGLHPVRSAHARLAPDQLALRISR